MLKMGKRTSIIIRKKMMNYGADVSDNLKA